VHTSYLDVILSYLEDGVLKDELNKDINKGIGIMHITKEFTITSTAIQNEQNNAVVTSDIILDIKKILEGR